MSAPMTVDLRVGDARETMLQNGSVDLIVTSPPYGLDIAYHGGDVSPETWAMRLEQQLEEQRRVTRADGGRLALNIPLDATRGGWRPMYADAMWAAQKAGWSYRSTILWRRQRVSKQRARGSVDSATAPNIIAPVETIGLFSHGLWKRADRRRSDSDLTHEEWLDWTCGWWDVDEGPGIGSLVWPLRGDSRAWERHPAAFPEELARRLIKLLSFPGDVVLDPFVGSGTTCVAATQLNRCAIGIDIRPEYIESAQRRMAAVAGRHKATKARRSC